MARFSLRVLLLLPLLLLLGDSHPASAAWLTLNGQAPTVIANGGTSYLYPDQTFPAYNDSLYTSLSGVVVTCDLQLSKAGPGICHRGLDLSNSTDITSLYPNLNNTYLINNVSTFGWFSIDIPLEDLLKVHGVQNNFARTYVFDGVYPLVQPEYVQFLLNNTASSLWLNSEYTTFIEENSNLNVTDYMVQMIPLLKPAYVSANEVTLLQKIQATALSYETKVIYKFLDADLADPSFNQTYGTLLQNLTFIKTFASGILVPKSYIWPIDPDTQYLLPHTSLVDNAHSAKLEVYAYNFASDQYPNSYNYTFDPITEILNFIENYNFSVDGIVTDTPTTASEAISCYASSSRIGTLQNKDTILRKQVVISHNGDSGKYPGATIPAYSAAIQAGVDYIDCIVQITKDNVPICRSSGNLLDNTNVANSPLFQEYYATYPIAGPGVYTFDLTWNQVNTLSARMVSPAALDGIFRDPSYDGMFGIVTLAEVLSLAKNNSVGILIDIQNAVYIRDQKNLAIVDAVVDILFLSGYNSSDNVILQSEDSSVLARLHDLKVTYPLMYRVESLVSVNSSDFVEIKSYASSVNLYMRVIEPWDSNYFLIGSSTDVVSLAHAQNLTVYFQLQKNEPTSFAWDFKSDPTLELNYLVQTYEIDGIVTDFPTTVTNYLANQCIGNGLGSSFNYTIPKVAAGALAVPGTPPSPPVPDLEVVEPPLPGLSPASAPAPARNAASHVYACFFSAACSIVLHLLVILSTSS